MVDDVKTQLSTISKNLGNMRCWNLLLKVFYYSFAVAYPKCQGLAQLHCQGGHICAAAQSHSCRAPCVPCIFCRQCRPHGNPWIHTDCAISLAGYTGTSTSEWTAGKIDKKKSPHGAGVITMTEGCWYKTYNLSTQNNITGVKWELWMIFWSFSEFEFV